MTKLLTQSFLVLAKRLLLQQLSYVWTDGWRDWGHWFEERLFLWYSTIASDVSLLVLHQADDSEASSDTMLDSRGMLGSADGNKKFRNWGSILIIKHFVLLLPIMGGKSPGVEPSGPVVGALVFGGGGGGGIWSMPSWLNPPGSDPGGPPEPRGRFIGRGCSIDVGGPARWYKKKERERINGEKIKHKEWRRGGEKERETMLLQLHSIYTYICT